MAWYNETPVQSTPGKDLINLSPSVGSQKRVGGKKSRKGQFSHVFGRRAGALSVSGAASRAVCEVSPDKVSPLVLVLRTQKYSAVMY